MSNPNINEYNNIPQQDPERQNLNNANAEQNANQQNAEDSENHFQLNGQSYDVQGNVNKSYSSNICFQLLSILLFFIFTRQSKDGPHNCEALRDVGVSYMWFNVGLVAFSIISYIVVKCFKSNLMVGIDYAVRIIGQIVFIVLFQIGYNKSKDCGGLGVLVLIILIFMYCALALMVCLCCCFCACGYGAKSEEETRKDNKF